MAVHLITYDLKVPGRNYADLYAEIQSLGAWLHPLESVWFVDSTFDADAISERLRRRVDQNDWLLVIGVHRPAQGWLTKEAWTWIDSRVPFR